MPSIFMECTRVGRPKKEAYLKPIKAWLGDEKRVSLTQRGKYVQIDCHGPALASLRKRLTSSPVDAPANMVRAQLPERRGEIIGQWVCGPGYDNELAVIKDSPGHHVRLSALPSDIMEAFRTLQFIPGRDEDGRIVRCSLYEELKAAGKIPPELIV